MRIREIKISDHQKLIEFWERNYFVSERDSLDRFRIFLENNPGLSLLMEQDGKIIGSALGSYDGRRGYLQKLVVEEKFRRKGLGRQIVSEVVRRLKLAGAFYVPISVEEELIPFYERCGFVKKDLMTMSMDL